MTTFKGGQGSEVWAAPVEGEVTQRERFLLTLVRVLKSKCDENDIAVHFIVDEGMVDCAAWSLATGVHFAERAVPTCTCGQRMDGTVSPNTYLCPSCGAVFDTGTTN
jgi:hypothetical protein